MTTRRIQAGFTLIEMVMVIVITGVVAGMVAVFLRAPVQQYIDVARRAEMTDIADTALRRIVRDLRLALPNSVRVAGLCDGSVGSTCFIEFLPTGSSTCANAAGCLGGGRYRAGAGDTGDTLNFEAADTTFEVLGPMPPMVAGDQIVVFNLGIPGADAYATAVNRTAVSAVPTGTIANINAFLFPLESPGQRFHVISTPVTYACIQAANGNGGTLTRYWGYAIQDVQTKTDSIAELDALVAPATAARGSAVLASRVSACRFSYDANVVAQRLGLVTLHLSITEQDGAGGGTETITLYSTAHVSNQP